MRSTDNIENKLNEFNININTEKDRDILEEILDVQSNSNQVSGLVSNNIWRTIMRNKSTSFKAVATIFIAVCLTMLLISEPRKAWAIEETIEALKKYNAAYISGTYLEPTGVYHGIEMWMQNDGNDPQTNKVLVKLDNGMTVWTKDKSTYTYFPEAEAVYYENAITTGFSHWIGPEFYKLLSTLKDCETTYNYDPATRQEYATLSGSIKDVSGDQTFEVEFDVSSKLMTSIKKWNNARRKGKPEFYASEIKYYKQLPDSTFEVKLPANITYYEKQISIPQENLTDLGNPKYGMPIDGLTKNEAAKTILDKLYTAILEDDLSTIRKLVPHTSKWSDDSLRKILKIGFENQGAEILEIGDIIQESSSPLGPIAVVPVKSKRLDRSIWQDKVIIQFRNINGKESCVIHGPHGLPVRLE